MTPDNVAGRAGPMVIVIAAAIMLAGIVSRPAAALDLETALARVPVQAVFPSAEKVGPAEGSPPAAAVFRDRKLIGYVFLTSDVVASVGYAGKPVEIMVGLDLDGHLAGAVVVAHQEPILILGIKDSRLGEFTAQYAGIDIRKRVRLGRASGDDEVGVDMVSGASITSAVFSDSILRSARLIARARGIIARGGGSGGVDLDSYRAADWPTLLGAGAVRRLHLTKAQVARAFEHTAKADGSDKTFIDMYAALVTPAAIGQNLLGFTAYNQLRGELAPGAQVIFIGAGGFYSFRGYSYRKTGVFDRLRLIQGAKTLRLTAAMHRRVENLAAAGAPELRDVSLFVLDAGSGFDAARPWRLEVLVAGTGEEAAKFAAFPLPYALPAAYLSEPAAGAAAASDLDRPLWQVRWLERGPHVAIIGIALAGLTLFLFLEDWAARHRQWVDRFRLAFLAFALVYIGWIAAAQLSVINVLTFVNALLSGFRWDFFLLEPLIFILWGFVAVILLFWGRGIFCGWLCPFGALQELLNRLAAKLRVPQIPLPFWFNERLWPAKYIIFLGLLALSLGDPALAAVVAEVEPFKTAITLKFVRAWPFVTYAVVLLVAGLFVQRAFCRYLCPLGAALAIPANNAMFAWLKRRPQCGTECQLCASRCPVQAIHPEGRINSHECIYCLDCQTVYHDEHMCPPLIKRRKRREKRREWRQRVEDRQETEMTDGN